MIQVYSIDLALGKEEEEEGICLLWAGEDWSCRSCQM